MVVEVVAEEDVKHGVGGVASDAMMMRAAVEAVVVAAAAAVATTVSVVEAQD